MARLLAKHYRPAPRGGGPSWLFFIGHTTDSLWSVDLFLRLQFVKQLASLHGFRSRTKTRLQGGVPILIDSYVVGAVGVSGDSPQVDEEIAIAGAKRSLPQSNPDKGGERMSSAVHR